MRTIKIGIGHSSFSPLDVSSLIELYFDQILSTAAAIEDSFEQAFFIMVQLPYLQPFEDVNKRTSRLATNIPLIKHNYVPLSFVKMPHEIYTAGVLGVYELNDISLLKAGFIWAYERSVERYTLVKQSLGEPDWFRSRYRHELKMLVVAVIRGMTMRKDTLAFIKQWAGEHVTVSDREVFQVMVEDELLNLHPGNFVRYGVRPSEFEDWQRVC